jgi:hypothetical protein
VIAASLLPALFVLPFVPFVGGFGMMFGLRDRARGAGWAAFTGLGIAAGFIVLSAAAGWMSFTTDTGYANNDCPDGCWDFPSGGEITLFVVGVSLVLWLVGVGVAAVVSAGLAARDRRRQEAA